MVALKDCSSSAIKRWGYDPASRTLALVFNNGTLRHFPDVPADVAAEFEAAESKGRAYSTLIRGKFDAVDPATSEAVQQ